jgi:hypothetical protein
MPPRPKYQSVIDFLEEIRRSVSGVPAGAEFYLSVARGLTPGATHVNKFGRLLIRGRRKHFVFFVERHARGRWGQND